MSKVEQKSITHETILESASRLVRQRGIAGLAVAEVMKGAGLTVGGFYAHFVSKTALIEETLRKNAAELRGRLFARIEEKPAGDRAEVILKRYLSPAHRDLPDEGCALPATVGEIGTTAPELSGVLKEQLDALTDGLEDQLPASGPMTRRTVALGLVALMYGGLSLARALKGTELSDEMLKACRALGAFAARSDARRSS